MRKVLLLFVLFSCSAAAQDQLFRTDNTKLLVKVITVTEENVIYKLYDNLTGPDYIESKKNVALIVYQNGQHQVFTPPPQDPGKKPGKRRSERFAGPDSALYFKYEHQLSMNFMSLFNNELSLIYRREFYYTGLSLVVPLAMGVGAPSVTQDAYFNTSPVRINLQRKIIEAGVGLNYYPSLRTKTNYYVGPCFRYLQYEVSQEAFSWPAYMIAYNETVLSRYAFSITNGLVFRTRSRLTTDVFVSLGFTKDRIKEAIYDPAGDLIVTLPEPLSLYWWSGFLVGFCF